MPDNLNEMMWWALNGSILVVAFYMRNDLKEIKDALKERRAGHDDHEKRITKIEVKCGLLNCDNEHKHQRDTD